MTKTTLSLNRKDRKTLRTTIPFWIVEHYKLKVGDKLDWDIKNINKKLQIIAIPVKE